jgi:hypothetical protein
MDLLGIALAVLGICVTVAIAIYQHRKAETAERKLESLKTTLPAELMSAINEALARQLSSTEAVRPTHDSSETGAADPSSPQTRYADIDGDGRDELLIEFLSGPHSTTLLVFNLKNWEFTKIAELQTTTPCGFDLVDYDDDGQIEVETVEIASFPDLPYVYGLRDRVTHKFLRGHFVEVKRVEGWDESDIEQAFLAGNQRE